MSKTLTLGKLSEYDDLLTDHLVDKVFFWIKTHKADRYKNISSRRAKTHQIVRILQTHVIPIKNKKKLELAIEEFLNLYTVHTFYKRLDSGEQKDFQRHLKKYLSIYLPSAGFEICSTNRYPGPKAESCIIANKNFRAGEILEALAGTIVAMTEEEEDYYEAEHDFSILHSSRLDAMCLFLGPARFVNHDCDPNGAFVTQGGSIAITTIKPVHVGDEITVFYSPDYFGPGNVDCLCETCEREGLGGYQTEEQKSHGQPSVHSTVKKRSQVQTIEVSRRKSTSSAHVKRGQKELITPPASEVSLDDAPKTSLDDSETESFHFLEDPYASDSDEDDDDDCIVTADLGGRALSYVANKGRSSSQTVQPSMPHAADDVASDVLLKRALRPRKNNCDYNLKRQSLLSLIRQVEDDELIIPKSRRQSPRQDGKDYCEICDGEMPIGSKFVEIWSGRKTIGTESQVCQRCARHAKLYKDPWPKRTPVTLRRSSTSELETLVLDNRRTSQQAAHASDHVVPALVSPPKPPREPVAFMQEDVICLGHYDRGSAQRIELAKAQLKQGQIIIPRLSVGRAASPSHGYFGSDILQSTRNEHGCSTAPSNTEPATSKAKRDELIESNTGSRLATSNCKTCLSLFCKCLYNDKSAKVPFRPALSANSVTDALSSDLRSMNASPATSTSSLRHDVDIYSFDDAQAVVKSCTKLKKRTISTASLKIDRATLNMKHARPLDASVSPKARVKHEMTTGIVRPLKPGNHTKRQLKRKASSPARSCSIDTQESNEDILPKLKSANKRRSAGSWYYAEVHSSDTDGDQPVILSSRTRSEDKKRAAVTSKKRFTKYFAPISNQFED